MHELDILQKEHWADCHPVLDPSILVILMGMLNFTDTNLCQGILYCVICGLLMLYFFILLY